MHSYCEAAAVNYIASWLSSGISWRSGLALQVKYMVSRQECSNGAFVVRSCRRWQDLESDMAEYLVQVLLIKGFAIL